MQQNDAVFHAVCGALGQDSFDLAVELTKEERDNVVQIVTSGILSGKVDFTASAKAKYDTDAKVKGYVGGMVSNHLRKDKRLNGGAKFEVKNPGSRSGAGDDQLKALKALRSTLSDADAITEIDAAIFSRTAELNSAKVAKKVKTINLDALPEALRHLVK